jgi:cyclophilin family peptidyl-prolyl cis-trans isomerase
MNFVVTVNAKRLMRAALLLVFAVSMPSTATQIVRMQTDLGAVDIELFDTEAPITVTNFLNYVNDGDYDGTFVHRSVPGFVVQLGGFVFNPENGSLVISEGDRSGAGSAHIPVDAPIINEPDAVNRPNVKGTLAMAKTSNPDSATSEWFFNLVDNPSLDDPNNSGGFTVFGRVLGDGMDVIEAIASQAICQNMLGFQALCGPGNFSTIFKEMPLVGMFTLDGLNLLDQLTIDNLIRHYNLVEIRNVGFDNDGDGIIDPEENAGPNNGDANNDGIADSAQQHVATFQAVSGSQITVESPAGTILESIAVLGQTFALSTYNLSTTGVSDLPPAVDGLEFVQGYVRYRIQGIQTGGSVDTTYTVAGTTSRCQLANSFFQYGPTPGNSVPHWYEFLFDGETGAEIIGDKVTLHYVDGKRGDSDLSENGVIASTGGPSSVSDDDEILPEVEDGAENDGDGNNDGVCDSAQSNVLSLPDLKGDYVTLEIDPQLSLNSVAFLVGPEIDPLIFDDAQILEGFNLQHNLLSFRATLAAPGDTATIRIVLSQGESPDSFFKFGPTPDDEEPHWYEFLFDGETGAEINGNEITLHFVDGKRGDSDTDGTNGIIFDPGAPAFKIGNSGSGSSSGGGGGCSLSGGDVGSGKAGAWWLLLGMVCLYGGWHRFRKYF